MKTPYWLAENGYIPDPENPLHFTNPNGHPFYPVTFTRDRQHNQGECLEAMLEAAHAVGISKGTVAKDEAQRATLALKDPQCDGCRWSWAVFNAPIGHPLDAAHCYMFRDRVEGCCKQETTHQRPKLAPDSASGNLPVSNSVKNVRINID